MKGLDVNKGSSALIQQLLQAEEKAEAIVTKAREDAVRKRRDARNSADEESKVYRHKEDERFQLEYLQKFGNRDDEMSELEKVTTSDLAEIKRDFERNKDKVVQFNTDKTITVDLTVPERMATLIQQMERLTFQ